MNINDTKVLEDRAKLC